MTKPIDVSAGVIERAGRILIAQRGPESHLALLWEFPGGKREPGETWEACLARELDEELGVEVEVGSWLDGVTHEYGDRTIRLRFYRCRLVRGEPGPVRCHAVRWVRPEDLPRYAFPEADAGLVAWLSSRARGRPAARPAGSPTPRRGAFAGPRGLVRIEFLAGAPARALDASGDPDRDAPRVAARGVAVEMPRGSSLEAAAERCGAGVRFGCRTGDCGACSVRVVSGAARLSSPTAAETALLAETRAPARGAARGRARGPVAPRLRLACQARALGDVVVAPAPPDAWRL